VRVNDVGILPTRSQQHTALQLDSLLSLCKTRMMELSASHVVAVLSSASASVVAATAAPYL
jgi:hypothetical protein